MIFDNFGNKINDDGTPINAPLSGALPDLSNEVTDPSMVVGGSSSNYQQGVSGWTITKDGTFELGPGNFRGQITVGGTNLLIDGVNKRIVLNDGTTNRVVIGNL